MRDRALLVLVAVGAVCLGAAAHTSVVAPLRTGVASRAELMTILALAIVGTFVVTTALARIVPRLSLRRLAPHALIATTLVSLAAVSQLDLRPAAVESAAAERADGRPGVRLRSDWRGPATRDEGDAGNGDSRAPIVDDRAALLRVMALLVAGALFAAVVALRRRSEPAADVVEVGAWDGLSERDARQAVVIAIDGLLGAPDPRTAIIGAYARLLEELESLGAHRHVFEAPLEHLNRVLGSLPVRRGPVEELAELFAIARFSEHPLLPVHRERAMAALRSVAEDLGQPAARRAESPLG